MAIEYIRICATRLDNGKDARRVYQRATHELTGGIVHMLLSNKWLTLDEIVAECKKYNKEFESDPYECLFSTDAMEISECISLLCGANMVAARQRIDRSQ